MVRLSILKPLILTIGHSRRSWEEFVELLWLNEVSCLIDVRSFPRSRFQWFNLKSLAQWVPEAGVAYLSLPELGGMRSPMPDSPNGGLRNDIHRSIADHLPLPAVREALAVVMRIARDEQVAIMCSEGVPWKCHRLILSDALVARGYPVEHILSPAERVPHVLSPLAHYAKGELTYPVPVKG